MFLYFDFENIKTTKSEKYKIIKPIKNFLLIYFKMEIVVTKYSDKSYKLAGKDGTTKYKDKLKEFDGVSYNRYLKVGTKNNTDDKKEPGWIVKDESWEKVKEFLKSIESEELMIVWPKE